MNKSRLPLEGLRVVELATVVAAPTAARMLCAYGAEVIKVESLRGDELRGVGKVKGAPYSDGQNPIFTVANSNKRLIAINFKTPEGMEALLKLIATADVFISNVREASLRRSGLDYDSLKGRFPELIYAHFSGYGPKGPSAADPGFDNTAFWLRSGPLADWQEKGASPSCRPTPSATWPPALRCCPAYSWPCSPARGRARGRRWRPRFSPAASGATPSASSRRSLSAST